MRMTNCGWKNAAEKMRERQNAVTINSDKGKIPYDILGREKKDIREQNSIIMNRFFLQWLVEEYPYVQFGILMHTFGSDI